MGRTRATVGSPRRDSQSSQGMAGQPSAGCTRERVIMRHQWILSGLIGLVGACAPSWAMGAESRTIAQQEAKTCEGIPAADRDKDPLLAGADVRSVIQLRDVYSEAAEDFDGAAVVLRATPGLTAEWLARVVDCRLARNAARGSGNPDSADSPLSIPGVSALVTWVGDGFAVSILSSNDKTAAEIWRRVQKIPVRL
jgi:hypothetical protein